MSGIVWAGVDAFNKGQLAALNSFPLATKLPAFDNIFPYTF